MLGKTEYMVMSRDHNAAQIHNIQTGNSSQRKVEQIKHFGTTLIIQNSIQDEIKNKLESGNACYHSVQNLVSYSLLHKNIKVKIYRTIILPVVLYGCEPWSLTLREERRVKLFENMVLTRIFGLRKGETTGEWRRLYDVELNDLYSSPNIIQVIKSRSMRWAGHVEHKGERSIQGFVGQT